MAIEGVCECMVCLEPLFGLTLGAKTKARCNLGNSSPGKRNGNARARERPARLAADSLLPETQVFVSAVNDFFNVDGKVSSTI